MSCFKIKHSRCVNKSELHDLLLRIGKLEEEVEIVPIKVFTEMDEEDDVNIHNTYLSVSWEN